MCEMMKEMEGKKIKHRRENLVKDGTWEEGLGGGGLKMKQKE